MIVIVGEKGGRFMVHHEPIVVEDDFIYLFSTLGTCFAASLELFALFKGCGMRRGSKTARERMRKRWIAGANAEPEAAR
jgi:hypothetical protein